MWIVWLVEILIRKRTHFPLASYIDNWVLIDRLNLIKCHLFIEAGNESRWQQNFPHPFRQDLRRKQPPVPWVPGLFPGRKTDEGWRWPPNND